MATKKDALFLEDVWKEEGTGRRFNARTRSEETKVCKSASSESTA